MAYLVLKRGEYRRRLATVRLREVRVFRFMGYRRVLKSERYVKKGRVLVITGGKGTGKTRELMKLWQSAKDVWGVEGVYISVSEAPENWFRRGGLSQEELRGLRQFEKFRLLAERVRGKVVLLDDVDRAESKLKQDAVKLLIRNARAVVVSCEDVHKINDSVELELRQKLRLRAWQGWGQYLIDLGRSEIEVKDVGMVVAIVLIVFVALAWGIVAGLMGALAMRYIVAEGRRA